MAHRFKKTSFLLLFSLLCLTFEVHSQAVEVENYAFMNLKADTIVHFGKSRQYFKPFFASFRAMVIGGKKQVNIYHIGDSHLQADFLTGQTRKNFQSFMPGLQGARGMVTPFMKGCPDSYKLTFSQGWTAINIRTTAQSEHKSLWGTSVYTTQSGQSILVNVNNRNPIKYDFNSFRVYHSDLTSSQNLILDDLNVAYSKKYYPDRGYTEFILSDYVSSIKVQINKSDQEPFYIYGFYFDNHEGGVVYNVTGTNGVGCNHYNAAGLLQEHFSTLPADLVIISLGTNDTYEGIEGFEQNLTTLIHTLRESHQNIPILLVTPNECWWHKRKPNPRSGQTKEIILKVAQATSCAVLDMYTIMGGAGSAKKMQQQGLMQADLVHMTTVGYTLEGNLLFNALWQEIENNLPKR